MKPGMCPRCHAFAVTASEPYAHQFRLVDSGETIDFPTTVQVLTCRACGHRALDDQAEAALSLAVSHVCQRLAKGET